MQNVWINGVSGNRRTSEWKSNHTRKPNRTLMRASIRVIAGDATHWSRSRTCNSDRGDLLEKVFASDNKHYHDTRHDVHTWHWAGTANTWAMATATVATSSRSWRRKRGSYKRVLSIPSLSSRESQSIVRYQLIKSVNAVNEITQHAISFTLFGALLIFGTPHYDLWQAR